jgi:hypothetical protein
MMFLFHNDVQSQCFKVAEALGILNAMIIIQHFGSC